MQDFILEVKATAGDMHLDDEYLISLDVDFCMQDFSLEVRATAGDRHLGTEVFDYLVVDFCMPST